MNFRVYVMDLDKKNSLFYLFASINKPWTKKVKFANLGLSDIKQGCIGVGLERGNKSKADICRNYGIASSTS